MRSVGRRVANRAASLLGKVASSLGEREYVATKKLKRSLYRTDGEILPLRYDYRAGPGDVVNLTCCLDGESANVRVFAADDPQQQWKAGRLIISSKVDFLRSGDVLTIDLRRPSITRNGRILEVKEASAPDPSYRRFITEIHQLSQGKSYCRLCSHYSPFTKKAIQRDYYFGDDYSNYPVQTNTKYALDLLLKHGCRNRLLDVGCALGVYTKAFVEAGFDAYGTDISSFAIDQAVRLVGPDRVKCADLDTEEIPFPGSFDTIWMWDVLEHFARPSAVLEKVSQRAAPGATLLLHTSNSESLSHRLFGRDWEGYSDYSHQGVDDVNCTSLRNWLVELGWDINALQSSGVWMSGIDSVMLRLQEAFDSNPELTVFLEEAELGDFITVIASKAPKS